MNSTLNNCHINATCNDTVGSFECYCNDGFSGDGVNCTGMHDKTNSYSDDVDLYMK